MGGDIHLDLILFGAIALFLVLKLGNVLGKRTGHHKRPGDMFPGGPPTPRNRDAEEEGDDDADKNGAADDNGVDDAPVLVPDVAHEVLGVQLSHRTHAHS